MKTVKSTGAAKSRGLILLAVVLAVLFWKSFLPGYVHFSNDGPLGQLNTAWNQIPDAFTGIWGDMNDIGSNGGSATPDLTALMRLALHPLGAEGIVLFAKFLPVIALFILGLGAWTFFRQLKLSPLAATLGTLAAALNSDFFSTACWGVAAQQIAIGFTYFALALVVSNTPETPALTRWARLALAGLAVGVNVMEAADIGAIFSLCVAAFVFYKAIAEAGGSAVAKIGRGAGSVLIIAAFAGFMATQTVVSLVGTQIQGVAGTGQDAETKAAHWGWATQWSLPKTESLGLFVPGLFGYKLDTPNNMDLFQDTYRGGNYWGAIGRDPALDPYFENGAKGTPPSYSFMRQTGSGYYVGILVALLAAWTIAQSLRRQNSVFGENRRRMIWFWSALLLISLPLAFGRFGFFGGYPYRLLYELPGASFIRNPNKFILVFSWAIVVLFAYGVDALQRRYLEAPAGKIKSSISQLQSWWKNVRGFDRKWIIGCGITFAASVLAWLVYASQKTGLVSYLQTVGFSDKNTATEIAAFSIGQAGWFLLLFAAAILLCLLIIAGVFSGKRAKLGGILLGALLLVDLGRANLPWIVHWNYPQKYATNPIVDILRDKPYEHRVIELNSSSPFEQLYQIEWVQQLFPYYNIQSLDLVMRPRVGSDLELYERILQPSSEDKTYLVTRHWQLTNVRYLLGPASYLDSLNQQLDPAQKRFRIADRFDLLPKQGVAVPDGISPEQYVNYLPPDLITAQPSADGPYALFEFTGALPRAKLYTDWQVSTNDDATLKTLADINFDPQQTVLLSAPLPSAPTPNATNENPGTVEFKSYTPKDIVFTANATAPSVLLLNDKYDSNWSVTVDGKPAELLRCNFIMRGVYLAPGAHTVEFQFSLPHRPLYITLAAVVTGILLCGFLLVSGRRNFSAA